MLRVWAWSLTGELRSQKPRCDQKKKEEGSFIYLCPSLGWLVNQEFITVKDIHCSIELFYQKPFPWWWECYCLLNGDSVTSGLQALHNMVSANFYFHCFLGEEASSETSRTCSRSPSNWVEGARVWVRVRLQSPGSSSFLHPCIVQETTWSAFGFQESAWKGREGTKWKNRGQGSQTPFVGHGRR